MNYIVYIYDELLYVDSTSLSTITLFDKYVDLTICRLYNLKHYYCFRDCFLASNNLIVRDTLITKLVEDIIK